MTTTHPAPSPRIGDADRARAQSVLATAHALGYLTPDELDERLGRTLTVRTAAELATTTGDLPVGELRRHDPARAERRRRSARRGLRAHGAAYALMVGTVTSVWLLVGLLAGAWFPWPVFPVLGGLVGLGSHAAAVRSGRPAAALPCLSGAPGRVLGAGHRG